MPHSDLWVTFHPPRMAVTANLEPVIGNCMLAEDKQHHSTETGVLKMSTQRVIIILHVPCIHRVLEEGWLASKLYIGLCCIQILGEMIWAKPCLLPNHWLVWNISQMVLWSVINSQCLCLEVIWFYTSCFPSIFPKISIHLFFSKQFFFFFLFF